MTKNKNSFLVIKKVQATYNLIIQKYKGVNCMWQTLEKK